MDGSIFDISDVASEILKYVDYEDIQTMSNVFPNIKTISETDIFWKVNVLKYLGFETEEAARAALDDALEELPVKWNTWYQRNAKLVLWRKTYKTARYSKAMKLYLSELNYEQIKALVETIPKIFHPVFLLEYENDLNRILVKPPIDEKQKETVLKVLELFNSPYPLHKLDNKEILPIYVQWYHRILLKYYGPDNKIEAEHLIEAVKNPEWFKLYKSYLKESQILKIFQGWHSKKTVLADIFKTLEVFELYVIDPKYRQQLRSRILDNTLNTAGYRTVLKLLTTPFFIDSIPKNGEFFAILIRAPTAIKIVRKFGLFKEESKNAPYVQLYQKRVWKAMKLDPSRILEYQVNYLTLESKEIRKALEALYKGNSDLIKKWLDFYGMLILKRRDTAELFFLHRGNLDRVEDLLLRIERAPGEIPLGEYQKDVFVVPPFEIEIQVLNYELDGKNYKTKEEAEDKLSKKIDMLNQALDQDKKARETKPKDVDSENKPTPMSFDEAPLKYFKSAENPKKTSGIAENPLYEGVPERYDWNARIKRRNEKDKMRVYRGLKSVPPDQETEDFYGKPGAKKKLTYTPSNSSDDNNAPPVKVGRKITYDDYELSEEKPINKRRIFTIPSFSTESSSEEDAPPKKVGKIPLSPRRVVSSTESESSSEEDAPPKKVGKIPKYSSSEEEY